MRWRCILCGLALALLPCPLARALPPDDTLAQLYHTQWRVQDRAPSGIRSVAQTADGYLWIAASAGLFRFDGVAFERIDRIGGAPLPSDRIYEIWARPAGGLWVSYLFGGASFIAEGTARHYGAGDGLPADTITSFAEDAHRRMWASTTGGVLLLDDGHWRDGDAGRQLAQAPTRLILDRDGTLWLLTPRALHFLRRDSRRLELALHAGRRSWVADLARSADGRAWLARAGAGITELRAPTPGRRVRPRWRPRGFEDSDVLPTVLIDRDSNLWLSVWGQVTRQPLERGGGATAPTTAAAERGVRLAGGQSGRMLEDAEGNIWAASSLGLDRFRASEFVTVGLERASYGAAALAAAADGSVWISAYTSELHRFEGGLKRATMASPHGPFDVLHLDHAGTLWMGGPEGAIHARRGGRWRRWKGAEAGVAGDVQAIASQPDGTMWVSILKAGVFRVVDDRWVAWGGLGGLPRNDATALAVDPAGRLWVGYIDGRIAVVDEGGVTVHGTGEGLAIGAVQVIATGGRHTWVGGAEGLARFDGRRFHPVRGGDDHGFGNVNGIVERARGDVWLNTGQGAVLISAGDVRRAVENPARAVAFRLFDFLDGMPGATQHLSPLPTAVESGDGRLWFSTTDGVVTQARSPPERNAVVPRVHIKSITVDGNRIDVEARGHAVVQLPPKPHVLRIAYTAPSFRVPERVGFQYRLQGSPMGWEDVGTRREAFFTGLPPGTYRFQVTARNDSGVWNATGASIEFVVPPTFLQSRAFLVICVIAACAAVWLLFVLRVRRLKARLQWRSEARLLERERIARDLHDTFLQGIQGLMLRFQTATERIPDGEPARALMEDALDRADRVLADGRDKVSELRATARQELPEALAMAGNELAHDSPVHFHARVEGTRRALDPQVREEAYRIGAEALTNAFRHARATRISMTTVFGRRRLEVIVTDDGCGFDVAAIRERRWGLTGMHERAARIRGKIALSSTPGLGTTLELRVPAGAAYRDAGHGARRWRRVFEDTPGRAPDDAG